MDISKLLRQAKFNKSCAKPADLDLTNSAKLVFMGCSNVGKSSLLNALCGQKRLAFTSKNPGATKLINIFDLADGEVQLIDLPGYGYAKISLSEQKRIENLISFYLNHMQGVKSLLWLIDGRVGLKKSDMSVVDVVKSLDCPVLVVLTKADTLSNNKKAKLLKEHTLSFKNQDLEVPLVWSSSRDTSGMSALLNRIRLIFS